ncbi:MAG: oxidoreductase [Gammaproteobacteria bacterium]|jgi:3-hydroxyisobutyrate dehydrogenase-like beta-hydroxyacid dehydrogenase|nr:MAG: oxidoreductase [Gammaproteobacteria bacterium]
MLKVGFIGLGTMGFPIAGHISKSYKTLVFNRTTNKSQKWTSEFEGEICESVKELTLKSKVIILCLSEDRDIEEVVLGTDGILEHLNEGTIVVDHSTTSADTAILISKELLKKGSIYLDAPVSGGEAGAQNGKLSVMLGGDSAAYKEISSILDCYSAFHKYMGPSGNGQLTKMINQICIAGLLQALAEAASFSKKSGISSKDVLDVISKGAAQSWQMENRWESMIDDQYNFGFAVDLMVKDLEIVSEFSKKIGANISITETIKSFYKELQAKGAGKLDTSSLLKRLDMLDKN